MSETLLIAESTPRLVDAETGLITPAPASARFFSVDGEHLIAFAGSTPATIRVHLTADFDVYWDLPMGKNVLAPLFGGSHMVVISGSSMQAVSYLDGSVLWSVSSQDAFGVKPASDAPVFFRTTGGEVPVIQKLSAENGSVTTNIDFSSSRNVVSAAGGYFAIERSTGIGVYNTATDSLVGLIPYPPASGVDSIGGADIHPSGDRIVVYARGDADTAGIYSLPGLDLIQDISGLLSTQAKFSPSGNYLYGVDGYAGEGPFAATAPAAIYDASTLEVLHSFNVDVLGATWASITPPAVPMFWTGLKQSSETV